jgi:lipopolysaccharide assembly outer membrane protein LptD (OstA)
VRLFRLSSWKLLCAALLLLAVGLPLSARAQLFDSDESDDDAPFDITADSVEYETERGVYVARGNVVITQPGRSLTADWVTFSSETRQGVATGDVVFSEADDVLYADVLSFEIDTLKGIVLEGLLEARASGFEMTGETILRTGEETYTFEDGTFTTCRCPEEGVPPWQIHAKTADVEMEGYVTTRNTSFEILGVPVLWLPWMRYPVKSERQTGFLLPEFAIGGRSGARIGFPFFWAARPNVNVTVTPTYLFDRGFKPSLDVEYVFGERSYGNLYGTIIDDQDIEENSINTPFDSTRWAVEWIHDQFLPRGWRAKVDATFFSDNLYPFDFEDFRDYKYNRFIESRAFAEKRFGPLGRYGFNGGLWWADDVQNPDDQDRDDFLLQRLPDLELTGMPQGLPGFARRLFGSFDVDYTHFYSRKQAQDVYPRANVVGDDLFLDTGIDAIPNGWERNEDGIIVTLDGDVITPDGTVLTAEEYLALFEDPENPEAELPELNVDGHGDDFPPGPENDGRFAEGEPLGDRGHRMVLNPRVGLPFRIADRVEVLPEFGYQGTFYQTSAQGTKSRSLFTAMLDTRIRMRREVDFPFGQGRGVHLMEPRLVYTGVTSASQDDNPLFVPEPRVFQKRIRQFELFNLTRNPADRIESVNAITAGLGNRFYIPMIEGEPPALFADVSFSAQYDFASSDTPNFYAEGTVFPHPDVDLRFNLGYDVSETAISEGLLEARYRSEKGNDLTFSYRYLRDIPRFYESFTGDEDRYQDFEQGFQKINQFSMFGRLAVTQNWALSYAFRYSFESEIFLTNWFGVEYISKCRCWAIRVQLGSDRAGDLEFNVQYVLIGLGDDDVRPFSGGGRRTARGVQSGAQN